MSEHDEFLRITTNTLIRAWVDRVTREVIEQNPPPDEMRELVEVTTRCAVIAALGDLDRIGATDALKVFEAIKKEPLT